VDSGFGSPRATQNVGDQIGSIMGDRQVGSPTAPVIVKI
jgi:hypothetical protein